MFFGRLGNGCERASASPSASASVTRVFVAPSFIVPALFLLKKVFVGNGKVDQKVHRGGKIQGQTRKEETEGRKGTKNGEKKRGMDPAYGLN